MKIPEPPIEVIHWRERFKKAALDEPPRCCHTCIDYVPDGYCRHYQMNPPEEFTQQIDQCPDWEREVPF